MISLTAILFFQKNLKTVKYVELSIMETPPSKISSPKSKKVISAFTDDSLTIKITDEFILQFFKDKMIDPELFIRKSIVNYNESQNRIDPHLLKGNYEEIKKVVSQKKTLLKLINEFQQVIYLIKFPESDKLLLPYFGNSDETILTCDICNTFRVYTKKGMVSHQRKCAKNMINKVTECSSSDCR